MSDERGEGDGRFARLPRTPADTLKTERVRANFSDNLDAVEAFLHHAVVGGREAFTDNSPAYASGSMAIIRTAALFENDEFRAYLGDVPDEVVRGILTTRHFASHSGYRSMNGDVFWYTLTIHLPPYLASWRAAIRG